MRLGNLTNSSISYEGLAPITNAKKDASARQILQEVKNQYLKRQNRRAAYHRHFQLSLTLASNHSGALKIEVITELMHNATMERQPTNPYEQRLLRQPQTNGPGILCSSFFSRLLTKFGTSFVRSIGGFVISCC